MSVADRYALSQFRDFRQKLFPTTIASQPELASLIKLSEIALNDNPMLTRTGAFAIPFQIKTADSAASKVGRLLLDIDLELRRSFALMSRNTASPTRDLQLVDLTSIQGGDALRLELALSGELHHALASRPFDFLITLDWMWDNRYARSRVRSPLITLDPTERWAGIMSSAFACTQSGQAVITTMTVDHYGFTTFAFSSVGARA
ncbi:MAG: hypothetical protein ACHQFZ_02215 [Acidimicrobiales bacterium]